MSDVGTLKLPDGRAATLELGGESGLLWTAADPSLAAILNRDYGPDPETFRPWNRSPGCDQLHRAGRDLGAQVAATQNQDPADVVGIVY
jgi:hypothetical protein